MQLVRDIVVVLVALIHLDGYPCRPDELSPRAAFNQRGQRYSTVHTSISVEDFDLFRREFRKNNSLDSSKRQKKKDKFPSQNRKR